MTVKEKKFWVIGDIHGMYDPLKRIVDYIRFRKSFEDDETSETKLIFIGDYIDYGPSSKEVVDLLLELKKEFECVFLCGNHEDMMLQFMKNCDLFERFGNMWFRGAGGQNTVISFMPKLEIYRQLYRTHDDNKSFSRDEFVLEEKYLDFFNSLIYSHTESLTSGNREIKLAFTHASLFETKKKTKSFSLKNIELNVSEQLDIKTYDDFHEMRKTKKIWIEDLHLWNRDMPAEKFDDYILIHGHTPTPLYDLKYTEFGSFKPASVLPFVKFIDSKVEVTQNSSSLSFYDSLENIISINIDTGVAYGKALTALHIKEGDLLNNDKFLVIKTFVNNSRIEPDLEFLDFEFITD